MADKITWTTEQRKLGDLKAWDKNPRQLSDHDAKNIKQSMDTFGLADPLIVNTDNTIIGGHMRKRVIGDNGHVVDVRVPSRQLTDREVEELNIRLNRNSGEFDFDILANEFEVGDLLDWGFTEFDLGIELDEEPPEDPGAQVDKADELREKWQVESGQLWQLGEHRLICGDCTDEEVITQLFDIGFASHFNLMLTDPPYNTNFDGKYDEVYTATKGVNTIDETKEWDENFVVTEKALLLHMHFGSVDCNYYIFSGWYPFWRYVFPFFHDMGDDWAAKPFIWCKPFAISNVRQTSTANATEPIVMAYRKGHIFNAKKGTDNYDYIVLASNEGGRSPDHPTAKPLKLIEHLMEMGSNKDWAVFDPFLGSGTTLIACERLKRKCRGVEIEEKYCAVTLERYFVMTGDTPVLVD